MVAFSSILKFTHHSLGLCIAYFLGALLIISHFSNSPAIADTLLVEPGPTSEQLDKRIPGLKEVWNRPTVPRVRTGLAEGWQLYPDEGTKAAVFTPTVFYGCTMVVIVNGRGVVIGHFAQGSQGSYSDAACKLNTEAAVEQHIIVPLETAESKTDIDDDGKNARAWIVHSDTVDKESPGFKKIEENLMSNQRMKIPKANVVPVPYRASSGTGSPRPDLLDKLAIQWEPKADRSGAKLTVYIQSDTPRFVGYYDCSGKPVSNSKMKRNAQACLPKNKAAGPFASGTSPTFWNHTTPASIGPTAGTIGSLGTPITNTGPLST